MKDPRPQNKELVLMNLMNQNIVSHLRLSNFRFISFVEENMDTE